MSFFRKSEIVKNYLNNLQVRLTYLLLQRERKLEKEQTDNQKLQRQVQDIPSLEKQVTELRSRLEKSDYHERQLDNLNKQIQADSDASLRMKKSLLEQQKVLSLYITLNVKY